jgi:O-antigen/teichoic acid export membrane protein
LSIGRNALYNLGGTAIPSLLALLTVPLYLRLIGPERYGVLAIAWLILGYFGVFDLGLGKATAQRISVLRDADAEQRATAFGTALVANLVIGVVGGLVLWPVSWFMFAHEMRLDGVLRDETLPALPILALCVPVATTLGVFSGALMARDKFLLANRLSVTNTCLFQILPLLVAWRIGPGLTGVLAASVAARMIGLVFYGWACLREFGFDAPRKFDLGQLGTLFRYGVWVTITAVFSPILVVIDRFAIGAWLGAYAVTVYMVPTQLTSRVSTVSAALCYALFPRLAIARGEEAAQLARDGVAIQFALITPFIAGAYVLMKPGLIMWVGARIGLDAAPIGRLLLLTAWLQMFASVAYVRLEASGRPDLVSKVLLAELPCYLVALYFGLGRWGMLGAAWVYFLRMVVDLTLLNLVSARRFDHLVPILIALAGFGAIEAVLPMLATALWVQLLVALGAAVAFLPLSLQLAPASLRARLWSHG